MTEETTWALTMLSLIAVYAVSGLTYLGAI